MVKYVKLDNEKLAVLLEYMGTGISQQYYGLWYFRIHWLK